MAAAVENSGTVGVAVIVGVVECEGEAVGVEVCAGVGVGVGVEVGVAVGVELTHIQVRDDGAVIANGVLIADVLPEAGTLPVPDQPEQMYPEAGDET